MKIPTILSFTGKDSKVKVSDLKDSLEFTEKVIKK